MTNFKKFIMGLKSKLLGALGMAAIVEGLNEKGQLDAELVYKKPHKRKKMSLERKRWKKRKVRLAMTKKSRRDNR